MPSIEVILKKVGPSSWAIFGPLGNQISAVYRGSKLDAHAWATKWVTSWYNWVVKLEEPDEEKDRLP